jgi:threonine aldolase
LDIIDLRSDTVTKPTPAMRKAMAEAEVGDDVYGEDPTVNKLEALAAEMMGKEAALFVPSGSMGNQLALMSHCERGQEVICDRDAHIFHYEMGAAAALSGVQLYTIDNLHSEEAILLLPEHIRSRLSYLPKTRLICLENTLNRGGGTVMHPERMAAVYEIAKEYGLAIHLDGARIFNAGLALGCPVTELTCYADSVMFCLSKGLGAPVGSLLSGNGEFISRARHFRKMLGGGMRQAGVLAAAGLVALQDISHLEEDHAKAKVLAGSLACFPGLDIDMDRVETNMVMAEMKHTAFSIPFFLERLADAGVLAGPSGKHTLRFVTHRDVSMAQIKDSLTRIKKVLDNN